MIAHRDEIGVERRHLARVGFAAQHHRQRIGGVAGGRIGRDRIVALRALHQRAGDHRKRADDRGLMRQVRFPRAIRRSRRGSHRRSTGRGVIPSKSGSRAKARSRAAPKAARTAASPTGWPVAAAPQPRGHALEAGLAHEVADAFAGDDQFAALAVDMAEHGFGGGNAVQPDRALGSCMFMVGLLARACKGRPSRQIDQS